MKRIKYYIDNPVNKGTEENPDWENNLLLKVVPYSEANEEIAKREAYNGEISPPYDDGQPEPVPAPETDAPTWDELAAALQEGVDAV